jgi:hypothetical protein
VATLEKPMTRLAALSAKERVADLLNRSQEGDEKAVAEARSLLEQDPALWDGIGQLASTAIISWVRAVIGKKTIASEGVHRQLRILRDELGGPDPSPLERLCIQRVQMTWVQLWSAEALYAQNMANYSLAQHDFHQRRISMSQKRYLAAIRALATVRRLLLPRPPAVSIAQMNVGQHQTTGVALRTCADCIGTTGTNNRGGVIGELRAGAAD